MSRNQVTFAHIEQHQVLLLAAFFDNLRDGQKFTYEADAGRLVAAPESGEDKAATAECNIQGMTTMLRRVFQNGTLVT